MDDDIRDRFRSGRSQRPDPYGYGRPARPAPRPAAPAPNPQPAPKPVAQAPAQSRPQPQPVQAQQRPQPRPTPAPAAQSQGAPAPRPAPKTKKKRKKSKFKRLLLILLALLLLGGVAYGGYWYYTNKYKPNHAAVSATQTAGDQTTNGVNKRTGTIRMVAVGDSLAFDSLTNAAKTSDGTYDYAPMMANFKPYFDKADIRVCNQTTPGGGSTDGLSLSGYPTFNGPLGWNTSFAAAGCNVMNLASEHTNDKGQAAINNMLTSWDTQKNILAIAGANKSAEDQNKIRYMTVKDVKIAYLAYTTTSANKDAQPYSVNIYSDSLADQQITEAHKNANLVVVSINWGTENGADISAEQSQIAQHLADQSVDVVLGGGPRVLQPAKVLNGKNTHQTLVWFSLGNFLNSMVPINNMVGGMAIMDFDANSLQLNDPKLMPVYMHYEWTASQKSSNNLAARTNFKLYPLDLAGPLLAKSQNNTTVGALTNQVTATITKFAPVKIITSSQY